MTGPDRRPRVRFLVRYPAGGGRWQYVHVEIAGPGGTGGAVLAYPPVPGDLITLWDRSRDAAGLPQPPGGPVFRVLERMWMHSSWGSADWPYGEQEPRTGPLLEILAEPSDGMYRDEAPVCAEGTCEAAYLHGAWVLPPGVRQDAADPHEHQPYKGELP